MGLESLELQRKKEHNDWFDENDTYINQLLLEKRRLYSSLLNQGHQDKTIKSYSKNKGTFQRELRRMLNKWWSNISKEVQKTSDLKDAKTVYGLLNKVFGPTSSLVTPLKSKDNTTLIKEPNKIMQRWQEHFKDLFHNLSLASNSVIDSIPQLETWHHLNRLPTPADVKRAVNQINTGKTPGLYGIPVELLQTGKKNILHSVHDFIVIYWSGLRTPQDEHVQRTIQKHKSSCYFQQPSLWYSDSCIQEL